MGPSTWLSQLAITLRQTLQALRTQAYSKPKHMASPLFNLPIEINKRFSYLSRIEKYSLACTHVPHNTTPANYSGQPRFGFTGTTQCVPTVSNKAVYDIGLSRILQFGIQVDQNAEII